MKNILLTGGNGYIASALYEGLHQSYNITRICRTDFDLTAYKVTKDWFSGKRFDVVIHTAITGGSRLHKEDMFVVDSNLRMYYNLLDNHDCFDRFINIGSGAELYQIHTPYGLSKHVIRNSLLEKEHYYNIRIFAVFDENELDTRFIKNNINKYIKKEPLSVHVNKRMDFFYMQDFVRVIKYYIEEKKPPKEFNCTYENSYYLKEIADKINLLSDYTVDINLGAYEYQGDYIGTVTPINIKFIGLDAGIRHTYKLLNNICKL
jgi:nucleoside-diphosphate-sugar epimerase